MKKIAVLFSSLAFLLSSIGISAVHAAGAATLSMSPTSSSTTTGGSFVLSVLVNPNGASLDTARVELDWDASLLEVLSVDNGSMFPNLSPSNSIDNTNGDLSFGGFKFGTPVSSSGTMASVTFRALKAGTATVSVLSSSKLISDGSEMLNTGALGKATVTITGSTTAPIASTPSVSANSSVEPETSSGSGASSDTTADTSDTSSGTSGSTGTSGEYTPFLTPSGNLEQDALVYFGALAGRLPSTDAEWNALHCIAYGGCQASPQDTDKEGQALTLFGAKYATLPSTTMEWNVIHAIAYTNVFINWGDEEAVADEPEADEVVEEEEEVVEETLTEETVSEEVAEEEEAMTGPEAEQMALKYFGAFFGRMPASGNDWEALHCMAYGGCQGDPRDLAAEQEALVTFGAKYAKMPENSIEWNVLHTIAYTDLLLAHEQADVEVVEEVVVEEEVVEEEVVEEEIVEEETAPVELTLEQEAIGWFGKLAGRLPASDADWTAVHYMVDGYTPETQDLDAEAAAIATFAGTFGNLPSSDQDWKIISAIAYSGAF